MNASAPESAGQQPLTQYQMRLYNLHAGKLACVKWLRERLRAESADFVRDGDEQEKQTALDDIDQMLSVLEDDAVTWMNRLRGEIGQEPPYRVR